MSKNIIRREGKELIIFPDVPYWMILSEGSANFLHKISIMQSLFSDEQLNNMSRENLISLMQTMQAHQAKQEKQIQILTEKTKELEFMNALLST